MVIYVPKHDLDLINITFQECQIVRNDSLHYLVHDSYNVMIFISLLLVGLNALMQPNNYLIKYNILYSEINERIDNFNNHLNFTADFDNTDLSTYCHLTIKRKCRCYFKIKHIYSYYITIKYLAKGSLFNHIFNLITANFLSNLSCTLLEGKPNSNIFQIKYQIHHIACSNG